MYRYNHLQGYDASKIRVDNFISFLTCKKPGLFCIFAQVVGTPGHTSQNRDKSRKTGTYGHPILYYKAKSLCICLFSLSAKKLTNCLMQTRKIGNDCRVNFSWSSEHIFNFLRFVIQKLQVF